MRVEASKFGYTMHVCGLVDWDYTADYPDAKVVGGQYDGANIASEAVLIEYEKRDEYEDDGASTMASVFVTLAVVSVINLI